MLQDETAALGLPVRMVVLTIIGMAGLAAMVMFIGDVSLVPKSMHADITGIDNSTTASVIYTNTGVRNITVEVVDVSGGAVEGATVAIYGLHTSASGLTGSDGRAQVRLDTSAISVTGEGYMKLSARAEGFTDYQNDYALKVIAGR